MSNFDNNPYAASNFTEDSNYNGSAPVHVPDYFVASILVTLFCCLPFGIAGIIFASKAKSLKSVGNYTGALEQAKKARLFTYLALGLGLLVQIANIVIQIAAMNAANMQ